MLPGVVTTAPWPLQSYLELGALPGAVPCARLHARQVLWEWRLEGHADTVELLVSELVTNALRASEGLTPGISPVRLWLCSDRNRLVIQVWDGNHEMPVRENAQLEAESGRGLLLVETLSAEYGAYRPDSPGGKVVWATVAG
jgi:anti-sigma regulatory factor (Ser/Thr protein kinase)